MWWSLPPPRKKRVEKNIDPMCFPYQAPLIKPCVLA
jgi:hypothetical protein